MRKVLIILACILSLFIVSCGMNGTSKKAIEEGKVAIVSKEYEKARDLFQLAVNEDDKNTEAKNLLDLSNNYIELLNMINNGEYENVDELIDRIEKNEQLDIISANYKETKKAILENKEIVIKFKNEILSIETLLNEGNIDEAKSLAITKLEEVKGYKILEDRVNLVISKVNEIIDKAKSEILKYHSGDEVVYKGLQNSSYNGYDVIDSLKGKVFLYFVENQEFGSPREYMYDRDKGDIYSINQGRIFWVNNNNKIIYEVVEPSTSDINNTNINGRIEEKYLTKEQAVEIASKKFEEDFPLEVSNYKAVCNGNLSAGVYEVKMFDNGGRLFFGVYAVDAKSGSCWRN